MYVYIESDDRYEVGFYTPKGKWVVESDHKTAEQAAKRVNYLNGGSSDDVVNAINAAALSTGS